MNYNVFAIILLIAVLLMNCMVLLIDGFMWINFAICVISAILLIVNLVLCFKGKINEKKLFIQLEATKMQNLQRKKWFAWRTTDSENFVAEFMQFR